MVLESFSGLNGFIETLFSALPLFVGVVGKDAQEIEIQMVNLNFDHSLESEHDSSSWVKFCYLLWVYARFVTSQDATSRGSLTHPTTDDKSQPEGPMESRWLRKAFPLVCRHVQTILERLGSNYQNSLKQQPVEEEGGDEFDFNFETISLKSLAVNDKSEDMKQSVKSTKPIFEK